LVAGRNPFPPRAASVVAHRLCQTVDPNQRGADCVRLLFHPMNPYVAFLLYLLGILGFVGFTLFLNRVLGPKPAPSSMKLEPFECGAIPVDPINVKAVPIKYYAVAIAFILFDLETVFLFIWALGAQPLTGFMLFTFFLFAFLLILILLYVYKARLLEAVTD
jgi:NADH-quinone oxidoreductase subunit A